MTQSEVVNKMSMEMALALGDLSHLKTCKFYINMALVIGTESFTKEMEEIVAMNYEGKELGRYKSESDASAQLGISRTQIVDVIKGRRHQTHGYCFIKLKDKELIQKSKITLETTKDPEPIKQVTQRPFEYSRRLNAPTYFPMSGYRPHSR
jgi:hypothetical protein